MCSLYAHVSRIKLINYHYVCEFLQMSGSTILHRYQQLNTRGIIELYGASPKLFAKERSPLASSKKKAEHPFSGMSCAYECMCEQREPEKRVILQNCKGVFLSSQSSQQNGVVIQNV
ncbi:hypothetical protein POVWA2_033830 [Plasmodium ovale wallikeri]|uniref:Uncharacterized protein n=1 Tax=Plasmodium ovale wallikeri TaxID=864142 RepID=A0A1A8YZ95_PLAOA|nr:hypothetical protein POVWA1_034650 [Plasmodium ovale wallikeri]SBT37477.1 hypothetical protein POVWA2_033830 [Plasmodium ovale wallikeri]